MSNKFVLSPKNIVILSKCGINKLYIINTYVVINDK